MAGLESAATDLYFACVDFLINAANLLGVTYPDANALLFFVVWPAVTLGLFVIAAWQATRRPARPRSQRRVAPGEGPRMLCGGATRRGSR